MYRQSAKGWECMLLRQMKYFAAVVECRSFTEAAAQCCISQSAISQQIQTLERELGAELIHRENRRFTLTPIGEYFYARSKTILEQVDELVCETKRLAADSELQLRIGYLRCYSGMELHQAIAEFSKRYPEVAINIVGGTHEELYDLLRQGGVDIILSDQRRAFSDTYVNYELMRSRCFVELSQHHPLSGQDCVSLAQLKRTPCILISSKQQQGTEQAYYQNTLGFGGSYLFADNLEEGRLMAASNRGFLPVESVGTLPPTTAAVRRLPVVQDGQPLTRNYCAFWRKDRTNYYIEEFAEILYALLHRDNPDG